MIVRASCPGGGYWIGRPHRLDNSEISTMQQLAEHLDWNQYVLLYIWGPGETERRQEPELVNANYVESWREAGFDTVLRNLPEYETPSKQRKQRSKGRHRRRWRDKETQ